MREINQAALDAGMARIKDLFDKAVQRRVLSDAEAEEALRRRAAERRTGTGFDDVDIVVEAAVENLDAKRAVFRELDGRTRPDGRSGDQYVVAAGGIAGRKG